MQPLCPDYNNPFPIYLDYNTTTPIDPRVLVAMTPHFKGKYGNASSLNPSQKHEVLSAIESARDQIAKGIGASHDEIVFTSGTTESNNLAIYGAMEQYKYKGDHIITCVTEHETVLEVARELEEHGKKVTYLPVDELGMINLRQLEDAITEQTVMISIMAANNEIGVTLDLESVGKIAHDRDVLFHTDAAQAVGHIPIDVERDHIDLMSFSAHKMYGPEGVGALYVRKTKPRVRLAGMTRRRGLRFDIPNVREIVGFGKAMDIATVEMHSENVELKQATATMLDIMEERGGLLNGDWSSRLPGNLNVSFPGVEGKAIVNSVSKSITISAGSARTINNVEAPSHVIMALGYGEKRARSSIRIGVGRFTEGGDVASAEFGAWEIVDAVDKLKKINR